MKSKRKKIWIGGIAALLLFSAAGTEYIYRKVERTHAGLLYTSTETVPYRKTGLLLGTSPTLKSEKENPYFTHRIEAATALYRAGKIRNILISGENSSLEYNEPEAMRVALLRAGVPDSVIYVDYAGFRTIDSVIRAKEIFGRDSITVISQPFHNIRALYIARHYGLEAVAYNAEDVAGYAGIHQQLREHGARVRLFAELYLLDYTPHFLGKKEYMP